MAIVVGLLPLTQFAAIQSSLQALTAGALNTYLGSSQFFGVLLVVLMAVGGLASVVVLLAAQLMTSGAGFGGLACVAKKITRRKSGGF